jgi:hypothetical protein
MCNMAHGKGKIKTRTGKAYKLVRLRMDGGYLPLYGGARKYMRASAQEYTKAKGGWIVWDRCWTTIGAPDQKMGFCLFRNLSEARFFYGLEYTADAIVEVEYAGAIGSHIEAGMKDCRVIIAKAFRVIRRIA